MSDLFNPVPASSTATKKKFEDYFTKRKPTDAHVALLFGDTGAGKTFTAMSYPEPLLVIDTENRAIMTKFQAYDKKDIQIFEPVKINNEHRADESALNNHQIIEDITEFIIEVSNRLRSGDLKAKTIVVDSCSDLWRTVQEWGIEELSRYTDKEGKPLADKKLMRVTNQFNWGPITLKHTRIMKALRSLTELGINVVLTAKEKQIPEFVKSGMTNIQLKDRIDGQSNLSFFADIIFYLHKIQSDKVVRYWGKCEKLEALKPPAEEIENLTYDKIKELIKK